MSILFFASARYFSFTSSLYIFHFIILCISNALLKFCERQLLFRNKKTSCALSTRPLPLTSTIAYLQFSNSHLDCLPMPGTYRTIFINIFEMAWFKDIIYKAYRA
jgi:hypothetical protein